MENEEPIVEVVSDANGFTGAGFAGATLGNRGTEVTVTTQTDHEHLRTLAIFHYIFAGMNGIGAMLGAAYVCFGSFVTAGALNGLSRGGGGAPPAPVGWFIILTGATIMLFALATVVMEISTAISLQRGKRKLLCTICSVLHCLNIPLGTALGVFTLIALNKPGIKLFFENQKAVSKQPSV